MSPDELRALSVDGGPLAEVVPLTRATAPGEDVAEVRLVLEG